MTTEFTDFVFNDMHVIRAGYYDLIFVFLDGFFEAEFMKQQNSLYITVSKVKLYRK